MWSDEQILAMFKNISHNDPHCRSEKSDFWYLVQSQIPAKKKIGIWWASGMSKFVVGWDAWDWVVKVPFNCTLYNKDDENSDYYPLEGAETFLEEDAWNYCQKEFEIYQDARAEGIEELFLEVRYIGKNEQGYPIYLQKRAYGTTDTRSESLRKYSDERMEEASEYLSSTSYSETGDMEEDTLFHFVCCWGREKLEKAFRLLWDHGAGDFHSENIGFNKNGSIVFIDYSGFCD